MTAVDRTVVLERPTWRGWMAVIHELRRTAYDMAIDLQGLMKSAVLARASGAARVVGFSIWHLREKAARPFYTTTEEPETTHVIRKNLQLLRAVGVNDETITLSALRACRRRRSIRCASRFRTSHSRLINPGAAWPNKRWPPDRFGELASFLR